MTRPVLVLGTEPRIAVTIARCLHRRGIPVDVASLCEGAPRLSSRAIRRFHRLPTYRRTADEFVNALMELLQAEQFDMLIPCSDTALTAAAHYYERLSSLLHVCCPPPQVVDRVLDKIATLEVAKRSGVAIPATYQVSDRAELEVLRDTLCFPMIAKPRSKMDIAAHTFKVRYFQSFMELSHALVGGGNFDNRPLLQEYCSGEGVGIGILMHNGDPIAMFQHRRLKELPSTGGVSVIAVASGETSIWVIM